MIKMSLVKKIHNMLNTEITFARRKTQAITLAGAMGLASLFGGCYGETIAEKTYEVAEGIEDFSGPINDYQQWGFDYAVESNENMAEEIGLEKVADTLQEKRELREDIEVKGGVSKDEFVAAWLGWLPWVGGWGGGDGDDSDSDGGWWPPWGGGSGGGGTYTPKPSTGSCKTVVDNYEVLIKFYSNQRGIKPGYTIGLMSQESAGNPDAGSRTGAAGLGQWTRTSAANSANPQLCNKSYTNSSGKFIPACAEWDFRRGEEKSDGTVSQHKPIQATVNYYAEHYNHFGGLADQEMFAYAAYNGGQGAIDILIGRAKKKYGTQDPSWDQAIGTMKRNDMKTWYPSMNALERTLQFGDMKKHAPTCKSYRELYESGGYK